MPASFIKTTSFLLINRARFTKFKDTDSIFAEALVHHTDNEPGSDHHDKPKVPALKRTLVDV